MGDPRRQVTDGLELDTLAQTGRDPYDDFLDDAAQEQIRADRLAERAPAGAYVERASERERREHFDETRVRTALRPRTGNVQPLGVPRCTCSAPETGYRHPGHLYTCPRYARRDERHAA